MGRADSGGGGREQLYATIIDIGALAVATLLTFQLFSRLDRRRVDCRPCGAGGARNQSEKAKALADKLKHKGGKDGLKLSLKEHELEVSADVVAPDAISVTFEDIGGLQNIGEQLRRNIILPFSRPEIFKQCKLLQPPKGILLHGPPGTGKTLLARAVAREAKFTFICLNPARLLSKWYGESNKFADAYFSLANKLAPSILFIDEIDCLFRTKGREHEATAMLKAQFLSLWDGLLSPNSPQIVVIAATNRPENVDPAVLRRLPLAFEVDLPGVEGRMDVLRLLLREEPLAKEIDLHQLALATEGYSGSDLEQLCKTAAMRSLEDALREEKERADEAKKVKAAKEKEEEEAAIAAVEALVAADEAGEGEESEASAPAAEAPCSAGGGGGGGSGDSSPAEVKSKPERRSRPRRQMYESMPAESKTANSTDLAANLEASIADDAARASEPMTLRKLTIDDFLGARAVVRPTRGRFAGVSHDVGNVVVPPVPAVEYDEDLYD